MSFSSGASNANGLIVAFHIKLYSVFDGTQNVFSIRNGVNNIVTLVGEQWDPTFGIFQHLGSGAWARAADSQQTVPRGIL